MRLSITQGIGVSALATVVFLSLCVSGSIHVIPEASAYVLYGYHWPTDANGVGIVSFHNFNLTSFYYTHTKAAAVIWNDAGAKVYFKEQTGVSPIAQIEQVHRTDVSWLGFTFGQNQNGVATGTFVVWLNDFYINGIDTNAEFTVTHELGHVLGLDHTQGSVTGNPERALMWPTLNSAYAPMLDDIRGAVAIYGARSDTSECNHPWDTNGSVTYTGTCSTSNAALPMTEAISTATSTSKALAVTSSTTSPLPSSNYFMITGKATATTVKNFLVGAFTTNDPTSLTNKLLTVRLSSNGMYLQTSSTGSLTENTITASAPTVGQTYFVQVIGRNGLGSDAYVWKDDGSPTAAPTFVGRASGTISLPWTTNVYYGTGVWTKTSTDPTSNYTVSEFYNLLKNAN